MSIPAILQQLNSSQSPSAMSDALQLWKTVRNAPNPSAIMEQIAARNPRIKQVMAEAGTNPKQKFYTKCAEMGVNPDEFLSQMMK